MLGNALSSERRVQEKILSMGNLDRLLFLNRAVGLGDSHLYMRPSYISILNKNEASAHVRFEAAKYRGEGKEKVALIEQEWKIYQQTREVYKQVWAEIDQCLVLAGWSMSELEQSRQEARARKQQQRQRELERNDEFVTGLILTLGAVVALKIILNSSTATKEQQDEARSWRDNQKKMAKFDCINRGGTFLDSGEYDIGTCIK